MGMYEFVLGIGTIIFLGIVWAILNHTFATITDIYTNMTNSSEVIAQYTLASNVFYFSYFFLVIVIIAWIIKTSMKQSENVYEYE